MSFGRSFLPIDNGLEQNPVNRLWVSYALDRPGITSGLLLLAAVCVDTMYGRPPSVDTLHFRGKSIALINEALSSTDTMIKDETISAVVLLVASEVRVMHNISSWKLLTR